LPFGTHAGAGSWPVSRGQFHAVAVPISRYLL
jgi:hypothetical protein